MSSCCPLSKFKNVLGEPDKGVHSIRFLGAPVVDYLLSILLAMAWTFFFDIPLVITTIVVLIISIILHGLFDVETPSGKYLGLVCSR